MQKNKNLALVGIIATTLTVGVVQTVEHVNSLNTQIDILNENVITLKEETLKHIKDLEERTVDNIKYKKENIKLSDDNGKLQTQINTLSSENKKLKEKVYPTRDVGRSSQRGTPVTITMTFYGEGAEENGGYAGMNAYGGALTAGTVASNVYPRGTKFQLPNGKILTVNDRGGSHFNSYSRLDVFVPRYSGESKKSYDKRISNYGRKTITMYKI